MQRSSIVQGIARWAHKEFGSKMPSFSPTRIGLEAIDKLAQVSPQAVEALAEKLPFGRGVQGFLSAAEVDFPATMKALEDAVRSQERLVLSIPTPVGPIVVTLVAASIAAITSEIETAEANHKAGATIQ